MARVAIVIPAYNVEPFLARTLESVLQSTFKDFEIVVVNDGSQDQTPDIAASFGLPVRVITQKNAGMSAARNKGIESSDSEFIALLDADDLWHPEKLALQVSLLDNEPEYSFVYNEFKTWNGIEAAVYPKQNPTQDIVPELSGWIYHQFVLTNWALPSTLLFRRSVIQDIGLFLTEDSKTDDWEYMFRAARKFQFAKLREVLTLYRQHPTQMSKTISSIDVGFEMRERMLKLYGMDGPDGTRVDEQALMARRHASRLSFAGSHIQRGDLKLGLKTIFELLGTRAKPLTTLEVLAKSMGKRCVEKIR